MVMPEHPERFMEGIDGGLFSFSTEKVAEVEVVENTDGGSSSSFSLFVGSSSRFSRFKTFQLLCLL